MDKENPMEQTGSNMKIIEDKNSKTDGLSEGEQIKKQQE